MDSLMSRFLTSLGVSERVFKEFDQAFFRKATTTNAGLTFLAEISLPHLLSFEVYDELEKVLQAFKKKEDGFETVLKFTYLHKVEKQEVVNFIKDYVSLKKEKALENFMVSENEITFEYSMQMSAKYLLDKSQRLVDILSFASLNYKVQLGRVKIQELNPEQIEVDFEKKIKKDSEINELYKKEREQQMELDRTYIHASIKDASSLSLKRVEVEGDIFKYEVRDIKNKTKKLGIIEMADDTYAICVNIFESKRFTREFIDSLKVGNRIRVKGSPVDDEYSKQVVIRPDFVEVVPNLEGRMDNYEGKKRIELHLHTKMSTLDGVTSIEDYVKRAEKWGWDAIAVTDHGGVQAFPNMQFACKGKTVKPIYGCELYVVDDEIKITHKSDNRNLRDETYVVFDIETTGLSAQSDRIIEFGAVKMKNNTVIDDIDFFINPDMPLPSVIKNLTHISDEQVKSGKSIKDALNIILKFIGDSTLVAHNGTFDYGFINEALKNNGMSQLKNPLIDTLPLSVFMYPKLRSHALGAICKHLNVDYDTVSAHRAVYDAEVLNSCFEIMLDSILSTYGSQTGSKLDLPLSKLDKPFELIEDKDKAAELKREIILQAPRTNHTVALVKNPAGLRDLFEIVSISNIQYIHQIPRVPKSLLASKRENLLIGSACYNGEVYDSLGHDSKDEIKSVMSFYDYIEVQPPENYSYLVNIGELSSLDAAKKIIRDTISIAKEMNKPVVATSDCHYLDPKDKINRDVYVYAKGVGGVRHPMFSYKREKLKYFENPPQHMRTTQEMLDEFSFLNDEKLIKEIVIDNTHLIADMISNEIFPIHKYLSAPQIDNCETMLKDLVYTTAKQMYGDPLPEIVQNRLDAEMAGISANHYEVIYWIASKLVRQANKDGYLVGSRGSVGSSLVATMAGITEVNPLPPHYRCPKCKKLIWVDPSDSGCTSGFDLPDKECPDCHTKMVHDGHNIPFATFIGFHAEKTPDIDLNFPRDYQARAHNYTRVFLTQESGNEVYKAGTTSCSQENNTFGYVKGYFETLETFYPELNVHFNDISRAELDYIVSGCLDVKRTTSQHPGGIIVIPRGMSVYDFTPIQYPSDDPNSEWITSQFDYNQMHDTILKLDLLGHVDPMALHMMSELSGKSIYDIPFNDKDVLSLFRSNDVLKLKRNPLNVELGTLGLPEFGTRFSMGIIQALQPEKFADLVRISGIAHGTDVFFGTQSEYLKDGLITTEGLIGCRDDIMNQLHENWGIPLEDSFQIMEIVRHGGFNPTANKYKEKYPKYLKMMQDHKVPDYYVNACQKIKYLFPKAHATAYVMMGYRVGWFKVHEPLAFYATYFTYRTDQYDIKACIKGERGILESLEKLNQKALTKPLTNPEEELKSCLEIALEMVERGYKFGKIDINRSLGDKFIIDKENNSIIPPFTTIPSAGSAQGQSVEEARKQGPFISVEDFMKRTSLTVRQIDYLREIGSFDDLPESDKITLF